MTTARKYVDISELIPYEKGAYLCSYKYFRDLIDQNKKSNKAEDDGIDPVTLIELEGDRFLVRNGASRVAALKDSGVSRVAYVIRNPSSSREMKPFQDAAYDNESMTGFKGYPICMDKARTKEAPSEAME